MEWMSSPDGWIGLITLVVLEIVLGVDNIIFISILSGKLPVEQQARALYVGLALAMITRILLLLSLAWIASLTEPLFNILGKDISGRDLILLLGGLFLIGKATHEIHGRLEGHDEASANVKVAPSFTSVIIQIILLDIVFSLDSVITAIGMVNDRSIMIIAVIIAVIVMLFLAGPISNFVNKHPTVKMLALAFLLLIGFNLVGEGLGQHIEKAYTYAAMAFSVFVEVLNLMSDKRSRKRLDPVQLHNPYLDEQPVTGDKI